MSDKKTLRFSDEESIEDFLDHVEKEIEKFCGNTGTPNRVTLDGLERLEDFMFCKRTAILNQKDWHKS